MYPTIRRREDEIRFVASERGKYFRSRDKSKEKIMKTLVSSIFIILIFFSVPAAGQKRGEAEVHDGVLYLIDVACQCTEALSANQLDSLEDVLIRQFNRARENNIYIKGEPGFEDDGPGKSEISWYHDDSFRSSDNKAFFYGLFMDVAAALLFVTGRILMKKGRGY
jgi:hypothetical protein